jgi:hypothetical protein
VSGADNVVRPDVYKVGLKDLDCGLLGRASTKPLCSRRYVDERAFLDVAESAPSTEQKEDSRHPLSRLHTLFREPILKAIWRR